MEHKDFKKLIINKCLNENCNQAFTEDNIKLVIWQYGLIILTQREVYRDCEEFFDPSIQDKETEKKSLNGYIGITCPKCSKTSLHKRTAQEIREFKNFLSVMLKFDRYTQDEKGESSIETLGPFPLNLRYYSPFPVKDETLKGLEVEGYVFDDPEDENYFFDDFQIHIAGEEKDLNVQFCSYIYEDTTPAGTYTNIYWFKEQDIPMIMKLENERGVRLLPRYHYFSDLMGKIDSLLKYYPHSEKHTQKATNDYDRLLQQSIKNLKNSTGTNNSVELPNFKSFLETRQKEIVSNPKMINKFFDILISEPCPLKNLASDPLKVCDYLWAEKAPFLEVDFPINFLFENQPDEFCNKAKAMMKSHQSMVDNVRENFTKQYVQGFLKNNLIDFLEEYEEQFSSNQFSYATVWGLKENYLKGLYKATQTGLRSELPYAMYREGEGWKIVFDGKSFSGLRGQGFLWLYLTLFHQPSPVYYTSLNDTYGTKPAQDTGDQVTYADNIEEDVKPRGHRDFEQEAYEEKTIDYMKNTEQLRETYSGVLTKQYYADPVALQKFQEELEEKELVLEKASSAGNIELLEEKMDAVTEFLEFLEKNYGIRKVKAELGGNGYKLLSTRFKDERYKLINNRIKKNYRDAKKILEKIKDAKDLHGHLSNYFKSEDGAFVYRPPNGINWHLD